MYAFESIDFLFYFMLIYILMLLKT